MCIRDRDKAPLPGGNSRPALPPECAVGQQERPAGGRFPGDDSVIPSCKGKVLHFVANRNNSGLALSNFKIAVRDKAVLGKVGADYSGTGIPVLSLIHI